MVDDEAFVDEVLEGVEVPVAAEGVSVDEPFWQVDRLLLLKFLRTTGAFSDAGAVIFRLKEIGGGDERFLQLTSTNQDAFLMQTLPLTVQSGQEVRPEVYWTDFKKLQVFVGSYSSFVFVFRDGRLCFKSTTVEYLLDRFSLSDDVLPVRAAHLAGRVFKDFPVPRSGLQMLHNLFSYGGLRVGDSKAVVRGKVLEAFLTDHIFRYGFLSEVGSPLVIRKADVPVLLALGDTSLTYMETDDRVFYVGDGFAVSFLRLPYTESKFMFPVSFRGDSVVEASCSFDFAELRRALLLLAALGTTTVTFTSVDDNFVLAFGDTARFVIGKGVLRSPINLDFSLLAHVVGTIPVSELVGRVEFSGTDIGVFTEGSFPITLSLSRTGGVARVVAPPPVRPLEGGDVVNPVNVGAAVEKLDAMFLG